MHAEVHPGEHGDFAVPYGGGDTELVVGCFNVADRKLVSQNPSMRT
jgi:hypothetical protein